MFDNSILSSQELLFTICFYAAFKVGSLANQAVQSINSPLSLFSFSIIFNILFSLPSLQEEKRNFKNDGKGNAEDESDQ